MLATRSFPRKMARSLLAAVPLALFLLPLPCPAADTLVSHSEYQAVDGSGYSTFNVTKYPVTMLGIVLNNPADMLDPTANFNTTEWDLGGQWQIFIQAYDDPQLFSSDNDPQDFGGTTLWMGQNYGNLRFGGRPVDPSKSYTNQEWNAELQRVNYPAGAGYPGGIGTGTPPLQAGDVIRVSNALGLQYKGKRNINEDHDKHPDNNFTITRLAIGRALPSPTLVGLAQLMDTGKTFLFDSTRQTGPEHLQGTRVTLQNVRFTGGTWAKDGKAYVTDDLGREFALHLGLDAAFISAPQGTFDVTGIFDQESAGTTSLKDGYFLWVMHPCDVTASGGLNRWNGSAGGAWSSSANWWSGQAPNAADAVARFRSPRSGTVNLDGNLTVGQAELDNVTAGYSLTGGTLTLSATPLAGAPRKSRIDVLSGSHAISSPVVLASSTEVSVAAQSGLEISGPIGGSGQLFKTGAGVLTLSTGNTYSGGTVVHEGMLIISNVNALPQGRSLTIESGASVVLASGLHAGTAGSVAAVPEPGTTLLGAAGAGVLVVLLGRRRK